MLSETREAESGLLFVLREELDRWLGAVRGGNGTWSPATDMFVDEGELFVEVEIPGVAPGDVEILTEGPGLTIRALSADPRSPGGADLLERRRGTYERTFTIPLDWDPSSAQASLRDGVLTLRIPRAPGARRIELEGERQTAAGAAPEPAERTNGNGLSRPGVSGFLMPSVIGGSIEKDKGPESH